MSKKVHDLLFDIAKWALIIFMVGGYMVNCVYDIVTPDPPAALPEDMLVYGCSDPRTYSFIDVSDRSSALDSVYYDEKCRVLAIIFQSNVDVVYVYNDVGTDNYKELMAADSMGSYYNTYIKGQVDCKRIDDLSIYYDYTGD